MKKNLLKIALISSAVAVACPAMADTSGTYVGIGFGQSKVSDWLSKDDAESDLPVAPTQSSSDDSGSTWKFFGGYDINNNVAIEGGYFDLGQVTVAAAGTGANVKARAKSSALFFNVLGKYKPTSYIDLFGKAGLYTAHTELTSTSAVGSSVTSDSMDHDKLGLHLGLGANAWITPNLGARLEWEVLKDVEVEDVKSDINVISASVIYKF